MSHTQLSSKNKQHYCSQCGRSMAWKVPTGEIQKRHVCAHCGQIDYENPKILVGCIATWQQDVLFMKRATNPKKGFWSIPTGFMEKGETPEQAVMRELKEETHAELIPESIKLYMVGSLPEISEVYLIYRGVLHSSDFAPSEEAESVMLFDEKTIKSTKTNYAYPEVADFLHVFCDEQKLGKFGVYSGCYKNEIFKLTKITV